MVSNNQKSTEDLQTRQDSRKEGKALRRSLKCFYVASETKKPELKTLAQRQAPRL